MLVFIDESGDPGFKISNGSSPNFVMSMVMFENGEDASYTQKKITALKRKLRVKPEFKFSKCRNDFKDEFFDEIADCNFQVRFVVVQKKQIYSVALRTVKESFYKFFIRQMMQHDAGFMRSAKVVVDGSGERIFKRQFKSYLRKHISTNAVSNFELKDSVKDPLLQLADMTAGCVARSYMKDSRKDCTRWKDKLQENGQLQNIWEFE